ncbi:MAG: hypothetical protein JWQ09_964 [Segetibacter sp.]|nr:hypothetical protein [Segetibacter sp.]
MKKLLPVLSLILIFGACKKDIGNSPDTNGIDRTDSIEGSTFSVAKIKNESAPITPAAKSKYHLLGYGYDVNGEYADSNSARDQVVDVERMHNLYPNRVVLLSATESGTPAIIAAENAEAFSEQLSNKLLATEGLKVFKSSITAAFPDTTSFYSKYIYALSTYLIQWKIAKLNYSPDVPLNSILNPAFSSDVENISAGELVKKYGTHMLSNITLGAKFEVLYQAETKSEDKAGAAIIGLTFGTKKVFGLTTGYFFDGLAYANRNASQKIYYKAIGGVSTKLPDLLTNNSINPTVDITNWIHSSTSENATLIDIDENGLIPIYDMIEDPIKKAAVKSYIDQYMRDNQVRLKN